MGKKLFIPAWVQLWLLFSSAVCALDGIYLILRPFSFPGGKYDHVIFKGWQVYAKVDERYNDPNDMLSLTIGRLNFVEVALNLIAIVLGLMKNRHSRLLVLTSSVMTFWKTAVYEMHQVSLTNGARDYKNPNADPLTWFTYFWVVNGIWMIVPFAVIRTMWHKLVKKDKHEKHDKSHDGNKKDKKKDKKTKKEEKKSKLGDKKSE